MAISYVQKATQAVHNAQSGTVSIELTGVSAGNCLVLTGSIWNTAYGAFTISSVSDGSAYTVRSAVIDQTSSFRQYQVIAYLLNAGAGTHTVTVTLADHFASNTYAVLGLAEFSGVATSSAEDTWDENSITNADVADVTAGPITTTDAGALLIGCAGFSQSSATSADWASPTSWTNLYRQNDGYNSGTGHDSAFWIPGSTQSNYTAQWSHVNTVVASAKAAAVIVALKAAAGGSTYTPRMSLLGVG